MRLAWIELVDFRGYGQLRWEPAPGVNLLLGRNGAGKTNLLESVGFLAALRSFRRVPDSVLIRMGAERAVIRGEVRGAGTSTLIEVELPAEGRRRTQVNRERLNRSSDLLGKVRTVVFLPDDLDIVKRGPWYRRDLLDSLAVQIWPGAYRDQQEYERTLRQRNKLLKQMGWRTDPVSLDVWDERLSMAGGRVMERRLAAIRAIEGSARGFYGELSGQNTRVSIRYQAAWAGANGAACDDWSTVFYEALGKSRSADMERRVSTMGPHRDDAILMLDEREARIRASQGEQRTLILALRLASHRAVEAATGEAPVLLLDDVFSELDGERSSALATSLPPAQTFITTARMEDVPVNGKRWHLAGGVLN